jgi:signal peptidase
VRFDVPGRLFGHQPFLLEEPMKKAAGSIRRLLDLALIVLVGVVLGIVLAVNFGPALGHELIVVRGGSMEPAIGLGSVIDIVHVQPADLRPGDVVTLKDAAGTLLSHRVNRVVSLPDGIYIETKGDANATPEAVLVPASQVVGRVDASIPKLGYVLYLLTLPTGILTLMCIALTMLFGIWLLEEAEQADETEVVLEEYESDLARFLDAQRMHEMIR